MLFFKPKCSDCGKREPIVHTDNITTMTNGDLTFRYCSDCYQKREAIVAENKEKDRKRFEPMRKEQEKQHRYEYLKREIELVELEQKAKELGIK
ncbi:hypothetical protein [Shouchella clausii]|uniref:hypothetical protein n=1 Tax=Shouchella clausii TaxID=79880 RepID=UPI000BA5D737|nr:hypothetical protein [Shouchella clausii]PAD91670.1 hypothetical protein CHH52_13695 [Shouchella clausii]